jgi:hypothetical protein
VENLESNSTKEKSNSDVAKDKQKISPVKTKMKKHKKRLVFGIFILVLLILFFGGWFVYRELVYKSDKFVETSLLYVNNSIAKYTDDFDKLPEKLADLELNSDASALVNKNLVSYKAEAIGNQSFGRINTYKYQLCVTYKNDRKDQNGNSQPIQFDSYNYTLDTSVHPAGLVCYKLRHKEYSNRYMNSVDESEKSIDNNDSSETAQ